MAVPFYLNLPWPSALPYKVTPTARTARGLMALRSIAELTPTELARKPIAEIASLAGSGVMKLARMLAR